MENIPCIFDTTPWHGDPICAALAGRLPDPICAALAGRLLDPICTALGFPGVMGRISNACFFCKRSHGINKINRVISTRIIVKAFYEM